MGFSTRRYLNLYNDTVAPKTDGGILYGIWGYSSPRDRWSSPVWCTVIQWPLRQMEESCMVYGIKWPPRHMEESCVVYGDTVAPETDGGVLYGKAVTTKADCYYFSKLETRAKVKKLVETYKHGTYVF